MAAKLLKTQQDYETALQRLEALMEVLEPSEEQNDEMKLLGILIEAYEEENFIIYNPLPPPQPAPFLPSPSDKIYIATPRTRPYDPCEGCPNNPKNGGSGICNCMIPYLYRPQTYSVIC